MASGGYQSQVFANEPAGFSRLLVTFAKIAIGPSTHPEYTLYRHKINDNLTMHQAAM